MQATYALFRDDGALKLPYCIAISGFVCALFAFGIPYLSALRVWLGFSTLFSLIYIVIAFVLSLRDGIILGTILSCLANFDTIISYAFLFIIPICDGGHMFTMILCFIADIS